MNADLPLQQPIHHHKLRAFNLLGLLPHRAYTFPSKVTKHPLMPSGTRLHSLQRDTNAAQKPDLEPLVYPSILS